jgi:hypothetical protein
METISLFGRLPERPRPKLELIARRDAEPAIDTGSRRPASGALRKQTVDEKTLWRAASNYMRWAPLETWERAAAEGLLNPVELRVLAKLQDAAAGKRRGRRITRWLAAQLGNEEVVA